MKALKAEEIRGNWATVLLPINKDDSIDYGRLREEVERIVAFGVDGLYTNGTAGEFHTQTEEEFDRIQELVSGISEKAQVPFQIGVSHMSPQLSRERLRRAVGLRPSAVQVIMPDWVFPQEGEDIAFMEGMAEVADGIGLILYNPLHAKRQLTPKRFGELKQAVPSFLGVKVVGGDADWYSQMRKEMKGLSVFVPGHLSATGIKEGAHGAYSNVACIHPLGAQKWTDLMFEDMEAALKVEADLQRFMNEHVAPLSRMGYSNSALDKLVTAIGGWAPVGTRLRWPLRFFEEEKAVSLREVFKRQAPFFAEYIP